MGSTHQKQLDSLLTLKFQLVTEEQVQKNIGRRFNQPSLRALPEKTVPDSRIDSGEQNLEKVA